jgi:KaiC/GvpD/RAD55 family RecA-like ATPase
LGHTFGETGEGKSVFGMEIANIIARGYSDWEIFRCDCPPQNVLYIDFELGNSSLAGRYTKDKFHKNLHIITINNNEYNNYVGWDNKQSERLDRAISFIEEAALRFDSKVIFIDNFSNIADQTEQAAEADRFISELYGRMKALDLTIMFLGHTPKKQKDVPITINHMKGSSSLAKTYESIISFKRSLIDDNISYIKQLKHRDLDLIFTDDNVGVFYFDKNGDHGYEINFTGFDEEDNLLKKKNLENNFAGKYDDDLIIKALYDKKINKLTWEEISVKYKVPIRTAEGFINKLKNRIDLTEKFEEYKNNISNNLVENSKNTSENTSENNIEDDIIKFKIKRNA